MIELVVQIKDGRGGFRRVYRYFETGGQAYAWYNQQSGKSVEKEIDSVYHRENPQPKKKKAKPKSE